MNTPEPYRLLFPPGLAFAVAGAAVWPLHALGLVPYPAPLHRSLMIEGFEQSFILGFLLTALPGFTKAERCHPVELACALLSVIVFGAAAFAGLEAVAHGAFLASVLMLLVASVRRLRRGRVPPAPEFDFVLFGLLLGLVGGTLRLLGVAGWEIEPVPRFADRLISLGMVLTLVLGVGGLLVPVFAGMHDPLVLPGIAGAHERRGRRGLYRALFAGLVLAFVAEAVGQPRAGGALRALAAGTMLVLAWKIARLPGRRERPAFVLWAAGWLVLAGLALAALAPRFATGALHLVFLGGFGLLTLGIGARVVVAHGRRPLAAERSILNAGVLAAIAIAIGARLAAEFHPAHALAWLGVSGAAWGLGWLAWGARALPWLVRLERPAAPRPARAPESAR